MTFTQKIDRIIKLAKTGEWAERISSEIRYLFEISKAKGGEYDKLLDESADILLQKYELEGAITKQTALELEEFLSPMKTVAKSYKELFLSHAHIDMNWMWGYNETASVTIETFRTVLNLMKEYPGLTFGQSQASTYEIIEKFAPSMLSEIKQRIKEGVWEVTASEWVEPDKNMPDGESLVRQVLQTKKYLSSLLEISPDEMNIDFVPDTFGHNINVPTILSDCGVKYYYHCRGKSEKTNLYYYVSPSGKKILTYMEYAWYNGEISPEKFCIVPGFCKESHINTYLCVYGIGDHGGGPSRRDIERILKYKNWPYTPDIKFGTMKEFFAEVESSGVDIPEWREDENCLFTGCYTTQTRIKSGNHLSENRLSESEIFTSESKILSSGAFEQSTLDSAWRNVLFNQFHDILPGSGKIETREYAMGKYQETLASANITSGTAIKNISDNIDTSGIEFDIANETTSEGGGVGFTQSASACISPSSSERGRGKVRAFNIFNPSAFEREETALITVWDYHYGFGNAVMTDKDGNEISFSVIEQGKGYWGHSYSRLAVKVTVPPVGYTTVVLKQKQDIPIDTKPIFYERSDEYINDEPITLENDKLKAVFRSRDAVLLSLTDKESGKQLISEPSCYFRLVNEDPKYYMTSWRVGPTMSSRNLNSESGVSVKEKRNGGNYSCLSYSLSFGNSSLNCRIELKKASKTLEFITNVDWKEFPEHGEKIPQLSFALPVSYDVGETVDYSIPFGKISRKPYSHDVPSIGTLDMHGIGLIAEAKYGFRYTDNTGSVTLIRSSYDPDPYPEIGEHHIRLGVTVDPDVKKAAESFFRPLVAVSAVSHKGILPLENSAFSLEGENIYLSALKVSEDGKGIAARIYSTNNEKTATSLKFGRSIASAFVTDSLENEKYEIPFDNDRVCVEIAPFDVLTLKIIF